MAVTNRYIKIWQDPARGDSAVFYADIKAGILPNANAPNELPEWKRATFGKNPTLGRITTLSMKEQRESFANFPISWRNHWSRPV